MRYLALDPGDKRIGLAVGDDEMRIATPLEAVDAGGDAAEALAPTLGRYAPDALVVGLPLHMSGKAGDRAKAARKLARALKARFELPVSLVDERLTTEEAEALLRERGLTRGKQRARRDAVAAAAILRVFFDEGAAEEA